MSKNPVFSVVKCSSVVTSLELFVAGGFEVDPLLFGCPNIVRKIPKVSIEAFGFCVELSQLTKVNRTQFEL